MAAGISRGLSAETAAIFTFGQWTDYIIAWNKLHDPDSKTVNRPNVRMATQKDFDNF